MTISAEAALQAIAFALASPRTGCLKPRPNRSDFGNPDSYGLAVRRIGRAYPCGDDLQDGDFGTYLGLHGGDYVVALQSIFPGDIIGCERFATLAELRARWELD